MVRTSESKLRQKYSLWNSHVRETVVTERCKLLASVFSSLSALVKNNFEVVALGNGAARLDAMRRLQRVWR